ncbi:hypothetical protein C8R46DRAFT_1073635, partial [Mycena filopes]
RVFSRAASGLPNRVVDTDACGIPRRPTWSVNELLSFLPQNTLEYEKLKTGLEELIRLVEAVKMVDTEGISAFGREDPARPAEANPDDTTPPHGRS